MKKTQKFKRFMSLLLSLIMIATLFPSKLVLAEEALTAINDPIFTTTAETPSLDVQEVPNDDPSLLVQSSLANDDNTVVTDAALITTMAALEAGIYNNPDANFPEQPGGNNVWRLVGNFGELSNASEIGLGAWNGEDGTSPEAQKGKFRHVAGEYYVYSILLPANGVDKNGVDETYAFKFCKNATWNDSIGATDGGNFRLKLTQPTQVIFYLNDELAGSSGFRTNLDASYGLDTQGIATYTSTVLDKDPRLVGDIQTALGESNTWSPSSSQLFFVDYYFNGSVFKLQRTVPTGKYECKVTFGDNWDENYGDPTGGNVLLNIMQTATVTFSIDYWAQNKVLKHDYRPSGSDYDGMIDKTAVYFDSQSVTYKKPFGAIKQQSDDVTFRIAAMAGDAQLVRLELIDESGMAGAFDLHVATTIDGKDYWEVTVDKSHFQNIGIWGYKFILIDGTSKVEYGSSDGRGGVGIATTEDGQTPYNLTVYDKNFKTPDWMKESIVYQIFPDRFFDGDPTNNRAKTVDGYRGFTDAQGEIQWNPLQYFDGGVPNDPTPKQVWGTWGAYPENPRQSTPVNKPYYPDAKTDNVWTNEFYGGDIKGIQDKIDYLKSIGVTAIYLNPVSWAASNHKYDATDYHHLDPMFGKPVYNTPGDPTSGLNYEATRAASDAIYMTFAEACKNADIHLIADGVFNHVGDDSIYFDRYEKYPEIGAYEFWKRVWDEVEKNVPLMYDANKYGTLDAYNAALATAKATATTKVKNDYKAMTDPRTGQHYTDDDFVYIDWFTVLPTKGAGSDPEFPDTYKYDAWWGYSSLPVINSVTAPTTNLSNHDNATLVGDHEYNNVSYRKQVIGYDIENLDGASATEAMKEANAQRWLWMGTSGWRLDVAPDVSTGTWQEFRKSVKSTEGKTDANGNAIDNPIIIGEEWGVATHYLLGDQFDSVMNYQFRNALQNFLISGNATQFHNSLEAIRENYPKEAWLAMLNLVGSHDTTRNITKMDFPGWEEENVKNAPEATDRALRLQALTAIFQMGYPGAPTIYYGDEVGVTGTKDPDSRRSFPWERVSASGAGYTATGKYGALLDAYTKAGNTRNENLDLFATGDLKMAYAQGDVIAYARKSAQKGGLVVINRADSAQTITVDVKNFLPDGMRLDNKIGGGSGIVVSGQITLTVPASTGMMMVSDDALPPAPLAPTNLTATTSDGAISAVELHWDAVSGATSYQVYRTLLEGMETEKIADVSAPTFTDTNVKNGTMYFYYVTTVANGQTSVFSTSVSAMPSFLIQSISTPTALSPMIIGVGKTTEETSVTIAIPGLTEDSQYTGMAVPGLKFSLVYQLEGQPATAKEMRLFYKNDDGVGGKVYATTFEPTAAGTYNYYAKATMDNGKTFTLSDVNTLTANPGDSGTVPTPSLDSILEESNRVSLHWQASDNENVIRGFDIFRRTENGDEIKIDTVENTTTSYIDYSVKNDTAYTYRIAAFDANYNRAYSAAQSVTPKLVLIDVTLRLHIPSYTPLSDDIFIAGALNGWNSSGWRMTVPSGATDRNIVEYQFKMMAGKTAEYKYTRGTWDTEAFTTKSASDKDSPGNYAYSSTNTNILLKAVNQGSNKMLVDEYVIRWKDMPMIVQLPRTSYLGEDIVYETKDASFDLMANVPRGVLFTMNGVDINTLKAGAMNPYGEVYLKDIPLQVGLNDIILHIETTQETINQPWFEDKGRATTATTELKITRLQDDNEDDKKDDDNKDDNKDDDNKNNTTENKRRYPEEYIQNDTTVQPEALKENIVSSSNNEPYILQKATEQIIQKALQEDKAPTIIIGTGQKGAELSGNLLLQNATKERTITFVNGNAQMRFTPQFVNALAMPADAKLKVIFSKLDTAVTPKMADEWLKMNPKNKDLIVNLYDVGLVLNDTVIGKTAQPISVTVDVSAFQLTAAERNNFTGVYFSKDTNTYVQLGGEFSQDGKYFTFFTQYKGIHAYVISDHLQKMKFTIGQNTYTLNQKTMTTDVAPFIDTKTQRTMMPIRVVMEALGAQVQWDDQTKTATITADDKVVKVTIGVPLPDGNGTPQILNDRMYVPFRYVSEMLQANVVYDGDTQSIAVYK